MINLKVWWNEATKLEIPQEAGRFLHADFASGSAAHAKSLWPTENRHPCALNRSTLLTIENGPFVIMKFH